MSDFQEPNAEQREEQATRGMRLSSCISLLEEFVHPPQVSIASLSSEAERLELARQIGRYEVLTQLRAELQLIKEAGFQ